LLGIATKGPRDEVVVVERGTWQTAKFLLEANIALGVGVKDLPLGFELLIETAHERSRNYRVAAPQRLET